MFVYIDESGNSGKNLNDSNQPFFYHMAMVSRRNIQYDKTFIRFLRENSINELHASEYKGDRECINGCIRKVIQENDCYFAIILVEKSFLAYAKFYDSLFDSYENLGARYQFYACRPLRLMMLSNFLSTVPEEIMFEFYEKCLLSKNEYEAKKDFVDICDRVITAVNKEFKDSRSKQVASEAIEYAKNHYDELCFFSKDYDSRLLHHPNSVTFIPVMSLINNYAKEWRDKGVNVFHDEQMQYMKIYKKMMETFVTNPNVNEIDLRDNGSYNFDMLKKSTFCDADSKINYGIQVVDWCIYSIKHKTSLSQLIESRSKPFEFTKRNCISEASFYQEQLKLEDLSLDRVKKGRELLEKLETDYYSRMNKRTQI